MTTFWVMAVISASGVHAIRHYIASNAFAVSKMDIIMYLIHDRAKFSMMTGVLSCHGRSFIKKLDTLD